MALLRRERGRAGENAAAAYLRGKGMRILARNWRQGRFELDLVCEESGTLVFVEVRTRAGGAMVAPGETLVPAKRRSLVRAANAYLAAANAWDRPCRFDVACVVDTGSTLEVEHHRHVFDLSEIVDSRHSAWQPW